MNAATKTPITVIEQDSSRGSYDMLRHEAIIEHPSHGRLYITQGFGGVDELAGGTYRWRHGLVAQLQTGDTLDSLKQADHNDIVSVYEAMVNAADPDRPVLDWAGHMVKAVAESAGL